jgi:hypothetical protein
MGVKKAARRAASISQMVCRTPPTGRDGAIHGRIKEGVDKSKEVIEALKLIKAPDDGDFLVHQLDHTAIPDSGTKRPDRVGIHNLGRRHHDCQQRQSKQHPLQLALALAFALARVEWLGPNERSLGEGQEIKLDRADDGAGQDLGEELGQKRTHKPDKNESSDALHVLAAGEISRCVDYAPGA